MQNKKKDDMIDNGCYSKKDDAIDAEVKNRCKGKK